MAMLLEASVPKVAEPSVAQSQVSNWKRLAISAHVQKLLLNSKINEIRKPTSASSSILGSITIGIVTLLASFTSSKDG